MTASSLEVRAAASSVSLFWMRELRRWWKPIGVKMGAFGLRVEDDRVVADNGNLVVTVCGGFYTCSARLGSSLDPFGVTIDLLMSDIPSNEQGIGNLVRVSGVP